MKTEHSRKEFTEIKKEYNFFEKHSTEAAEGVKALSKHLIPLAKSLKPVSLLDFGCGPGNFTEDLLTKSGFKPSNLKISLVEPDAGYLKITQARLKKFTTQAINTWDYLHNVTDDQFDLIISNHVMYYVDDLCETMNGLINKCNNKAKILITMATEENGLIVCGLQCFELLKRKISFHLAADFEQALNDMGIQRKRELVCSYLTFPDSRENRIEVLKFLLADFYDAKLAGETISTLDVYKEDLNIRMSLPFYLYIIDVGNVCIEK